MDEIPLLLLSPNDPETLLSLEARRRLANAVGESEALRMRALADAQFEFERAGEPDDDFAAFLLKSPAYREVVMESIRMVLRVQHREFGALDISSEQLRRILFDEIDGIVNSAMNHGEPIGDRDRRALKSEFFFRSYRAAAESDGSQQTTPVKRADTERPRRDRIYVDDSHLRHVELLDRVLEKISLEIWVKDNKGLCRTQVTDYRAGRISRRVSLEKRKAIEKAIVASAEQLGLSDSD